MTEEFTPPDDGPNMDTTASIEAAAFYDAVSSAMEQLERDNYYTGDAVILTHPDDYYDLVAGGGMITGLRGRPSQIGGVPLKQTREVPQGQIIISTNNAAAVAIAVLDEHR